jgi:hypothetical protein
MYQPLKVDGKDILDILDREDDLIAKNVLCNIQLVYAKKMKWAETN